MPEQFLDRLGGDPGRLFLAFGDLRSQLAADRADLPFQIAHPGFTRVLVDDGSQGILAEIHFLWPQSVLTHLARDQGSPWQWRSFHSRCSRKGG